MNGWFKDLCETAYGENMTQTDMALEFMKRYGQITPMDALEGFGCFRLSGRIFELREAGYEITTERAKKGYAIYRLKEEDEVDKEL